MCDYDYNRSGLDDSIYLFLKESLRQFTNFYKDYYKIITPSDFTWPKLNKTELNGWYVLLNGSGNFKKDLRMREGFTRTLCDGFKNLVLCLNAIFSLNTAAYTPKNSWHESIILKVIPDVAELKDTFTPKDLKIIRNQFLFMFMEALFSKLRMISFFTIDGFNTVTAFNHLSYLFALFYLIDNKESLFDMLPLPAYAVDRLTNSLVYIKRMQHNSNQFSFNNDTTLEYLQRLFLFYKHRPKDWLCYVTVFQDVATALINSQFYYSYLYKYECQALVNKVDNIKCYNTLFDSGFLLVMLDIKNKLSKEDFLIIVRNVFQSPTIIFNFFNRIKHGVTLHLLKLRYNEVMSLFDLLKEVLYERNSST